MMSRMLHAVAPRALRMLAAETAHELSLGLLARGLVPPLATGVQSEPPRRVMGLDFAHPVGLAAGFDKDARALEGLFSLGFSFVEAGTVTPLPQPGNPRPRLFRLSEDRATINRMGFNSGGLDAFAERLEQWRRSAARPGQIVGANVGANKEAEDRVADYVTGFERLADLAHYITVNVSSPNTPGLRGLQEGGELVRLLEALNAARTRHSAPPPTLLKVAPDLDDEVLTHLARETESAGLQGLLLTNTTIARPDGLRSVARGESGGLSGAPLAPLARHALDVAREAVSESFVLVGAGGIASGAEAAARLAAGASLIQLYTGFIYRGAPLIGEILKTLAAPQALKND